MGIMIVDRIEGEIAVCESGDGSLVDVPMSDLPDGVREGTVLRLQGGSYAIDEDEERSRRERIERKASRLFV